MFPLDIAFAAVFKVTAPRSSCAYKPNKSINANNAQNNNIKFLVMDKTGSN